MPTFCRVACFSSTLKATLPHHSFHRLPSDPLLYFQTYLLRAGGQFSGGGSALMGCCCSLRVWQHPHAFITAIPWSSRLPSQNIVPSSSGCSQLVHASWSSDNFAVNHTSSHHCVQLWHSLNFHPFITEPSTLSEATKVDPAPFLLCRAPSTTAQLSWDSFLLALKARSLPLLALTFSQPCSPGSHTVGISLHPAWV